MKIARVPGTNRLLAAAAATLGVALLALVVIAGLFGSQVSARNPANYLVWLYFWPGVPIAVAVLGDFWRYVNPWRTINSLLVRKPTIPGRAKGLWPAVATFAAFAWFDLASGMSDRPRSLAVAVVVLSALVVAPARIAGMGSVADPFGPLISAIGQRSLAALARAAHPTDDPAGWDRFALFSLPIAAAVFDAMLAMPQWLSFVASLGGASGLQRGALTFILVRTAALVVVAVAIAGLLLGVAFLVGPSTALRTTATRLALISLPATVAVMAAHNLPALVGLGPQLPAVLAAFITRGNLAADVSPAAPVTANLDSKLWTVEVALVALGLVWSSWLAWRDLSRSGTAAADRFATAYPAWILLLVISGAALLILYQPAAAATVR